MVADNRHRRGPRRRLGLSTKVCQIGLDWLRSRSSKDSRAAEIPIASREISIVWRQRNAALPEAANLLIGLSMSGEVTSSTSNLAHASPSHRDFGRSL